MQVLRSREGCPWDREQTYASLRPFLLEETYEALEAIDRGDFDALPGELGDVLFQCVFQSQIAAEERRFDIADAVQAIIDKLIRRHPHVFSPDGRPLAARHPRRSRVRTPRVVLEQWEQLKAKEQAATGRKKRILSGVPRALPALLRAQEIGSRVAAVGFDWPQAADVMAKIEEEVRELKEALGEGRRRSEEELGDFLFAVSNLARKLGLDPESALRAANDKFSRRFDAVEERLEQRGRSVHDASLEEMEAVWSDIKAETTARTPSTSGRARPARAPSRRRTRSRQPRRGRS
jgi:ATP diphosphatase